MVSEEDQGHYQLVTVLTQLTAQPLLWQRSTCHNSTKMSKRPKSKDPSGSKRVCSSMNERSISMLRLIKSPLRSTMGQDRLNGLAMLYYHRDVQITPEEVVDEFARLHSR